MSYLAICELADIEIHQRFLPFGGKHRSHGQKAQWRLAGLL